MRSGQGFGGPEKVRSSQQPKGQLLSEGLGGGTEDETGRQGPDPKGLLHLHLPFGSTLAQSSHVSIALIITRESESKKSDGRGEVTLCHFHPSGIFINNCTKHVYGVCEEDAQNAEQNDAFGEECEPFAGDSTQCSIRKAGQQAGIEGPGAGRC